MLRHKLRLLEAAVERHGLSCPALPSACTPLPRCFDVFVSASMPSAQPAYCSPAQASRHASLLSPRPKRPGPCSTGASASKPPFLSKVSGHLQARKSANSKCLDRGKTNKTALDVAGILAHPPPDQVLSGFAPWLDNHFALTRHENVNPLLPSRDAVLSRTRSRASFKCFHDQCIHYIYGFATRIDRDNHARLHSSPLTRNPDPPLGTRRPMSSTDQSPVKPPDSFSRTRMSSAQPPGPLVTTNLPPLPLPTPSTASTGTRDSATSFNFPENRSSLVRGLIDADVDPQLPPLKRARVGHHRLKSIGELQLLRENEPCLRCRALNRQVSASRASIFRFPFS